MSGSMNEVYKAALAAIHICNGKSNKPLCFGISIDKQYENLGLRCEDIAWQIHSESNDYVLRAGPSERQFSHAAYSPVNFAEILVRDIANEVRERGGAVHARKPTVMRRHEPVTLLTVDEHERLKRLVDSLTAENQEQSQRLTVQNRKITELKNALVRAKSLLAQPSRRNFKRNV